MNNHPWLSRLSHSTLAAIAARKTPIGHSANGMLKPKETKAVPAMPARRSRVL